MKRNCPMSAGVWRTPESCRTACEFNYNQLRRNKMRSIRPIALLAATLGFLVFGWNMPRIVAAESQTSCPVMGGKIDEKIFTDYQGKRVYFCCSGCLEEFKKDPDKYLKKLDDQSVTPQKTH